MDHSYDLPRDATERERLELQHRMYSGILGFLIHPAIEARLPQNAIIADIGTGTGAWLLDAAEHLPKTMCLVGLDISDAQFPASLACPSNCEFRLLNLLDPVPPELQNAFDMIHLRLLIAGLGPGLWDIASQNIFKMLKPGGLLQWDEPDVFRTTAVQMDPNASLRNCELAVESAIRIVKQMNHVEPEGGLGAILEKAGFLNVSRYRFSSERAPELRKPYSLAHSGAILSILDIAAKKMTNCGWTPEQVAELRNSVRQDIESEGIYFTLTLSIFVGEKPGA